MDVLNTCNNKDDLIKNEGTRVFTTLYINFSEAQWQVTRESLMLYSQNSNSPQLICITLLPARIKMIQLKMKRLEWSQQFSHYKSLEIFPNTQGQLIPQSLVRPG